MLFFGLSFFRIVLAEAGMTVMDTTRDAARQKVMESAIGTSSSLTMPVVKTIGRKTQIVVSVDETIAPVTCFAPWTEACGAAIPRPRSRKMFSMTTIELSTSMPTPSARPDSVIMLSDSLQKYMSTIVTMTDSGMPSATRNVGRISRRKIARIRIARRPPRTMLSTMLSTISVI